MPSSLTSRHRNTGTELRYPPTETEQIEKGVRGQKMLAGITTGIDQKAELIAALKADRLAAIKAGKQVGSLPEVHDQMSDADIEAAQVRLNGILGRPDPRFQPTPSAAGAKPGAIAVKPTAPAAALMKSPQEMAAPATSPSTPSRSLMLTKPRPAAATVTKMDQPPTATATPAPTPVAAPVLDATGQGQAQMARDMHLVPGTQMTRTPAGTSVTMNSQSGPREVLMQPSAMAALASQYGDVAKQKFGKGWADLTNDQRHSILQQDAAPVASRGNVTDPGATTFDAHGNRMVSTPGTGGGDGQEYDPTHDMSKPIISADGTVTTPGMGAGIKGGPALPAGAARGILIDPKYQTPGANPLATITGGSITDAGGNKYNPSTGQVSKAPPVTAATPVMPPASNPMLGMTPPSSGPVTDATNSALGGPTPVASPMPTPSPATAKSAASITQIVQPTIPPAPATPFAYRAGQAVANAPANAAGAVSGAAVSAADTIGGGVTAAHDAAAQTAGNFWSGFTGGAPVSPKPKKLDEDEEEPQYASGFGAGL